MGADQIIASASRYFKKEVCTMDNLDQMLVTLFLELSQDSRREVLALAAALVDLQNTQKDKPTETK